MERAVEEGSHQNAQGGSIPSLRLSTYSDALLIFYVFLGIVGFTFIFELANDLEKYLLLLYKQGFLLDIRNRIFEELTLFGLLSVSLFLLSITNWLTEESTHVVEAVHVGLLGLILLFVIIVIGISLLTAVFLRQWTKFESLDQKKVNDKYRIASQKYKESNFLVRLLHWKNLYSLYTTQSIFIFHRIRTEFICRNGLPSDFPFHRYLKRSLRLVCLEMIRLHWTTVAIVLGSHLALWFAFLKLHTEVISIPLSIINLMTFGTSLIVAIKLHSVVHSLGRNPEMTHSHREKTDQEKAEEAINIAKDKRRRRKLRSQRLERQLDELAEDSDFGWLINFVLPIFAGRKRIKTYYGFRTDHHNLFWFNSPKFIKYVIQCLLYGGAAIIFLSIALLARWFIEPTYYWQIPCANLIFGVFNLAVFQPLIYYNFSLSSYVGDFTRLAILAEMQPTKADVGSNRNSLDQAEASDITLDDLEGEGRESQEHRCVGECSDDDHRHHRNHNHPHTHDPNHIPDHDADREVAQLEPEGARDEARDEAMKSKDDLDEKPGDNDRLDRIQSNQVQTHQP